MARGWYRLPKSGHPYFGPLDRMPAGAERIDAPTTGELSSDVVLEKPAKGATKPDWVAYAIQEGIDVDGLSKPKIIAALEAHEQLVDAGENEGTVGSEVSGDELVTDPEQPGAVPGQDKGS